MYMHGEKAEKIGRKEKDAHHDEDADHGVYDGVVRACENHDPLK
jgi:hypothetical protein